MIVDYENPLKKMMEEFVPHGKVEHFTEALFSLSANSFEKYQVNFDVLTG